MRIGIGYDIHRLKEERSLILGGIHVPHTHGLDGHSDADALTHAVCDALLGAIDHVEKKYGWPKLLKLFDVIYCSELINKARPMALMQPMMRF